MFFSVHILMQRLCAMFQQKHLLPLLPLLPLLSLLLLPLPPLLPRLLLRHFASENIYCNSELFIRRDRETRIMQLLKI